MSPSKRPLINPVQRWILFALILFIVISIIDPEYESLSCNSNFIAEDTAWKIPEWNRLPYDSNGFLVREGFQLISATSRVIGPDAEDTSMRFSGNNLACANCHLQGGTKKFGLGLVGVYSAYPRYSERFDTIISIEARINECITRSMNGRALDENSRPIKAIAAYLKWLSTYVPEGMRIRGQGLAYMPVLIRTADTSNGRKVYSRKCASCHADDGSGSLINRNIPKEGYKVPPVWGRDSYSEASEMFRLITASNFIRTKMNYDLPISNAEAYDAAAFINSMPRPGSGTPDDYPNLEHKAPDYPFPPYKDSLPAERHRYGPYDFIKTEQ